MSQESIQKISSTDFKSTISKGLVLVDFFGEWCPPCRMLVPALEELAEEKKDALVVVKVDVDQAKDITAEYEITSLPTLVLFKDGKEVNRCMGLRDVDSLREFVDEVNS